MARKKMTQAERDETEAKRQEAYDARKAKLEAMTPEEKTAYIHGEKVDSFRELAPARVQKVMDALNVLEHCANTASYAFNEHQVQEITDGLTSALEGTLSAFRPKSEDKEHFSLSE